MQVTRAHYTQLLSQYLSPQWGRVLGLALLLFSGIGLELLSPQILRSFIDAARDGDTLQNLALAAGIYTGVLVGQQIVAIAARYATELVAWFATTILNYSSAMMSPAPLTSRRSVCCGIV